MSRPLASRLSNLSPSATFAIAQRAKTMQAEGIDVLSFSVGEPDFAPPGHVLDAARDALSGPISKYTAPRGILELREAIARDSASRRGQVHTPEEIVVSVGAKHTLYNLAMVLYGPGDEVLVPAPYWVSYPEQIKLAGATPVILDGGEDFRVSPENLAKALTPKTRGIILCTPSNPTGSAYSPEQLSALAQVLRGHDCWIVVDEIYSQLVYGDFDQKSLLTIAPDLRDRLIIVDGVSKTYAMTGWRVGWMLGPKEVAKAVDTLQGQSTSNTAAISQQAALAAVTGPRGEVNAMREQFCKRRDLIVQGLNEIDGIRCAMPDGAFYAFADVRGLVGKSSADGPLSDDIAVAAYFLEEARCAVVPGTAFGAPGYVRISYAASMEQIKEGLSRIGAAARKLS